MWFRRDLRLADNPALLDACGAGGTLPLFVLEMGKTLFGASVATPWCPADRGDARMAG